MATPLVGMRCIVTAVALCWALSGETVRADLFYVIGVPQSDSVFFASDAKLEFIEGKTNTIFGVLEFDPDNFTGASGRIRVDARTLKTGIELRDEHMRDRHLHTKEYPYIDFVLKSVSGISGELTADQVLPCEVTGDFTIHGTTRTINAPAEVTLLARGTLPEERRVLVSAKFSIKLDDYKVPRPKALFLRLAETINIRVRFVASTTNLPVAFEN